LVAISKVALVAPAGTVTLKTQSGLHTPFAGNVTRVLLEVNTTTEPPDGADSFKVTVPVDVSPFVRVVGFNVSDAMAGVEEDAAKEPALTTGTKRTASQTRATRVHGFKTFRLSSCAFMKVPPYHIQIGVGIILGSQFTGRA
jgi:hypothetical protein